MDMISKVMTRRSLLGGVAIGGLALASCTPAQISAFQTQWASVVSQIQNAVAVGAQYIPTIESIAQTAASLFGPAYTAIVVAGSAAFNQIVAMLVNIVSNLSPPASAKLKVKLAASSPNVPVLIGTTSTGVQVVGWAK